MTSDMSQKASPTDEDWAFQEAGQKGVCSS